MMNQDKPDRSAKLEMRNSKPRRVSEIWKLDRKTNLVLALKMGGIVQLNSLGSGIWLMLDGEHTIDCIIEEFVRVYPEQDKSQIEADVMSFIKHLVTNELVIMDWRPL